MMASASRERCRWAWRLTPLRQYALETYRRMRIGCDVDDTLETLLCEPGRFEVSACEVEAAVVCELTVADPTIHRRPVRTRLQHDRGGASIECVVAREARDRVGEPAP